MRGVTPTYPSGGLDTLHRNPQTPAQPLRAVGFCAAGAPERLASPLIRLSDAAEKVAEAVSLKESTVSERISNFDRHRLIAGCHAQLNTQMLGFGIRAFIGVMLTREPAAAEVMNNGSSVDAFESLARNVERAIMRIPGVLRLYQVTGESDFVLRVITHNPMTLGRITSQISSIRGVHRTETMVVTRRSENRGLLPIDEGVIRVLDVTEAP